MARIFDPNYSVLGVRDTGGLAHAKGGVAASNIADTVLVKKRNDAASSTTVIQQVVANVKMS
jgi:F420-0:gamma-glutamyl ligase